MVVVEGDCYEKKGAKFSYLKKYALLDVGYTCILFDLEKHKAFGDVLGSLHRVLPVSSTIVLTNGTKLIKYDLEALGSDILTSKLFVHETSTGRLFTISKNDEGKFSLEIAGERKMLWSSPSPNIKDIWINEVDQLDYEMLVQYEDLRVEYFNFPRSFQRDLLTPVWVREEALSNVRNSLFLDFQNEKELTNSYYETLLHNYTPRQVYFPVPAEGADGDGRPRRRGKYTPQECLFHPQELQPGEPLPRQKLHQVATCPRVRRGLWNEEDCDCPHPEQSSLRS